MENKSTTFSADMTNTHIQNPLKKCHQYGTAELP